MPKVIHEEEFEEEVLNQELPVIIDFFAEWCAPCKMLAPILEQFSEELEGKVKVVKIDIDSDTDIAQKYGVTAVPTLIVLKNGEVINEAVGLQSLEKLKSMIEE